jgi:peptide/nickel transport system permease protein
VLAIVVRRLAALPLLLLAVATLTFLLVWASPYDPATAYAASAAGSEGLSLAVRDAYTARWGLDDPVPVQYLRWLTNLATGDLGVSHLYNGQPVTSVLASRAGVSALLVGTALGLVLLGSIVAGTVAARFRESPLDHGIRLVAYASTFAPSFWVGLLLIVVFGVQLGWLPTGGTSDPRVVGGAAVELRYLVLPAVTLALSQQGWFTLFVRTSVLESMGRDHVRFARAQGASRTAATVREALPSSLLAYLTLIGTHLPELIGGTILIETVFGWPGLGDLARRAAVGGDLPLLLAIVLGGAVLTVLGNLGADLAYRVADPRVREGAT